MEGARGFARCLVDLFNGDLEFDDPSEPHGIRDAVSFEDAGVLTTNAGLVVRMDDGTEFQITVVRSR